jgi:hypothetical protein
LDNPTPGAIEPNLLQAQYNSRHTKTLLQFLRSEPAWPYISRSWIKGDPQAFFPAAQTGAGPLYAGESASGVSAQSDKTMRI